MSETKDETTPVEQNSKIVYLHAADKKKNDMQSKAAPPGDASSIPPAPDNLNHLGELLKTRSYAMRAQGKCKSKILETLRKINAEIAAQTGMQLPASQICAITAAAMSCGEEEAFEKSGLEPFLNAYYDGADSPYTVMDFCLVLRTEFGYKTIAKFVPVPYEEVRMDDGRDSALWFRINGYTDSGEKLQSVEIAAKDFNSMRWVTEKWGFAAPMPINSQMTAHLRNAISLSGNLHAKKITIYAHTGWRMVDGKWTFLHGNGGIGANGVMVKLEGNLGCFRFTDSPFDALKAVRTCLDFLKVAPYEITVPLIGMAFLSPLNMFFKVVGLEPSLLLFLLGQSKSKKSTLAALTMCFFGIFTGKTLPSSFKDTANALEKTGHLLKDVLTTIDDYYPSCSPSEKTRMEGVAQAIARSYGNRTGRGRMNYNTSLNAPYVPRGNVLVTGELIPNIGPSGVSRYVFCEIKKDDVDVPKLTSVQNDKDQLSSFMAEYIRWLIPLADTLPVTLKSHFNYYKNYFALKIPDDRLRESIAWLASGYCMFLEFIKTFNILTSTEYQELVSKIDVLASLAEVQSELQQSHNPVTMFFEAVDELLTTAQCQILSVGYTGEIDKKKGTHIGYEDQSHLFLMPGVAYQVVYDYYKKQGIIFPLSKEMLFKNLKNDGLLVPDATGKSTRAKIMPGKKSSRYLWIIKSALLQ